MLAFGLRLGNPFSLTFLDDRSFELSYGTDGLKLKGLDGVALLNVEREAAGVEKVKAPESLSCFRGFNFMAERVGFEPT